jgi:hypothetical protein
MLRAKKSHTSLFYCSFKILTILTISWSVPLIFLVTLGKQLHAKSNGLRAAGAQAIGEMLKTNKTLAVLDLSGNEIGGYFAGKSLRGTPCGWKSTP